jgi:hypothetical protein
LYRYPGERFLADLTGVAELGRRSLIGDSVSVELNGETLNLPARQWLTPLATGKGDVLGQTSDGPLFLSVPVGQGRVVFCGAYLGDAYFEGSSDAASPYAPYAAGLERFVAVLAREAGVELPAEVMYPEGAAAREVHVRTGYTQGRPMVFVFCEHSDKVNLRFPEGTFGATARELLSGQAISVRPVEGGQAAEVPLSEWGMAVLLAE